MTTPSRDKVYQAAFDLLSKSSEFTTKSRRFKARSQVDMNDMPAIYSIELGETYAYQSETLQKVSLFASYVIYAAAPTDETQIPSLTMNDLLDAIDDALSPTGADLIRGKQTLGDLVSHCYIEGDILKSSGDVDGKIAAIIPVRILLP